MGDLRSHIRLVVGFVVMACSVVIQFILLLFIAPFERLRIKACNYWGHVVGPVMMGRRGNTLRAG